MKRGQDLVGSRAGRLPSRTIVLLDQRGTYLIAEVEMAGEPALRIRHGDKGVHGLGGLEHGSARRRGRRPYAALSNAEPEPAAALRP